MKKYLNEIKNVDRITVFDELNEFLLSDDEGQYFVTEDDFIWWNELADALEKIENHKQELANFGYNRDIEDYYKEKELADERVKEFEDEINSSFNELSDYISIAARL